MSIWMDLKGTIGDTLSIGRRGLLDATGLTVDRVIALPDADGALLPATGGTLTSYRETVSAKGMVSGASVNFSFTDANIHTLTCSGSGAMTWTFTNPPPSGTAGSMTIIATNPGVRTIAITGATWLPEAPPLPTNGVALINAITVDGGETYHLTAASP